MDAGVGEFFVVVGFNKDLVTAFLEDLSARLEVPITPIYNEEWEKENGLSVLKAKAYIDEPFLLLMADHIFDSSTLRELIEVPLRLDRNQSGGGSGYAELYRRYG